MRNLIIATINESHKIFSAKRNFIFIMIASLIPLVAGISLYFLNPMIGILDIYTGNFSLFILGILLPLVFPIISCIVTLSLFSEEFANGTIKVSLLNPINRFKLFTSKILASTTYIALTLITVFTVSTAISLLLGIGNNSLLNTTNNIISYLVSIFPLMLIIIITAFISQLFKSGGSALAIIILLSAGLKVLGAVYSTISLILPTNQLDWYKYWDLSSIASGSILLSFTTTLGCIIIFFASGYHLFESKEF